jgi:hypothetical protein
MTILIIIFILYKISKILRYNLELLMSIFLKLNQKKKKVIENNYLKENVNIIFLFSIII